MAPFEQLTEDDLAQAWPLLSPEDRVAGFRMLRPEEAADFFLTRSTYSQVTILQGLSPNERQLWLRLLPPDDATDVIQEAPAELRSELLLCLDVKTRNEVTGLLAYAEDDAGGLMSPRFARLRPEMSVDEAITYLRRQVREKPETMNYAYVLDREQHLLGVASLRELLASNGTKRVEEIMQRDVLVATERTDQEEVARLIAQHDLAAIPVVDEEMHMKGIITVDDILDVFNEEATEDIQKLGGMEALDVPYMQTPVLPLVKKRVGWLMVLFVGGSLTATAMSRFEDAIAQAVILTVFVPLIIASGGNSGSQATTLVIRAMALGEVKLPDWWQVVRREFKSGVLLGLGLGAVGFLRVAVWEWLFDSYGPHYLRLAFTVSISLLGVVIWGTLAGSMLPFLLRRLGFDPASASAPFVATIVDVFGVVMYFTVAQLLLAGSLL